MSAPEQASPAPGAAAPGPADKIGDRFVAAGLLTAEQVRRVVERQQLDGSRFGEAAVRLGLLRDTDVQSVLSQQFRYATALGSSAGIDPSLAIALEPFGAEAEAVRRIRAELSIRLGALPKLALAVVSPSEGEGKSYLAASLAVAYAQLGRRTLLVNANMRTSGRQDDLFGLGARSEGLSTLLAGRSALVPGVQVPAFPLLHVLGPGPQPPNPLEILLEPALERMLAAFAEDFDVFIVDTPAATGSSDAQVIARQVGQCLLVGRRDRTLLQDLERTRVEMVTAGVQTVGIVYNTFEADARRRGGGLLRRLRAWARRR